MIALQVELDAISVPITWVGLCCHTNTHTFTHICTHNHTHTHTITYTIHTLVRHTCTYLNSHTTSLQAVRGILCQHCGKGAPQPQMGACCALCRQSRRGQTRPTSVEQRCTAGRHCRRQCGSGRFLCCEELFYPTACLKFQNTFSDKQSFFFFFNCHICALLSSSSPLSDIHRIMLHTQASIDKMVGSARVVVATAGPFLRLGTPIVDACARLGTGGVDVCLIFFCLLLFGHRVRE